MCVYHCAQWSYTTQHRTVLTIFPLILQTITIAQLLSTGGERVKERLRRDIEMALIWLSLHSNGSTCRCNEAKRMSKQDTVGSRNGVKQGI